jgi:ABC-2 type transport system permease protein
MNIFMQEMRTYRKSTLIWAISLSAMTVLFLLMYPAFTKDVDLAKQGLSKLPLALRSALGISLQNFFTLFGFFGYIFTYIVLAGAIQAMNLGVGTMSKEDSGKTADFLLTKPVSRSAIVTAKLLAAACSLLITNLVFIICTYFGARAITNEAFSTHTFLLITLSLLWVQGMFLALGALFSVTLPKIKSVIAISLPTVFALFIIGTLGSILGNDNVRLVVPFKFYEVTYIISHQAYEMKFVIIEAVFIILAITATYAIYKRKDIRATA